MPIPKRVLIMLSLFLIPLLMVGPSMLNFVQSDSLNAGLFSTVEKPYGLSYGEWTAMWWKWFYAISKDKSPASDTTGSNCAQKQSGPVWNLAGTLQGAAQRACVIPAAHAILAPILNGACTYSDTPTAKTIADLESCALASNSGSTTLTASIDGMTLVQLDKYRITSPELNVTMVDNNIEGVKAGPTKGISDGWWLFLKPLPPGQHTLHFAATLVNPTVTSTLPRYVTDVTYKLTVR